MKNQPETNERGSRYGQRRKRTNFSNRQLNRLEEMFEENHFPGIESRERLTEELGIREDRIQVWFQNRRARWRRHEIKNKSATPSSCKVEPVIQAEIRPEPTLSSCRYPHGVPQFTFEPTLPSTFRDQPTVQLEPVDFAVVPSPTPFTPLPSCQRAFMGVNLTHSFEEYEAAFGLLSVFARQD